MCTWTSHLSHRHGYPGTTAWKKAETTEMEQAPRENSPLDAGASGFPAMGFSSSCWVSSATGQSCHPPPISLMEANRPHLSPIITHREKWAAILRDAERPGGGWPALGSSIVLNVTGSCNYKLIQLLEHSPIFTEVRRREGRGQHQVPSQWWEEKKLVHSCCFLPSHTDAM